MNDTPDMPEFHGEMVDKWIAAIPDSPYDLCPCLCGKKFKFCIPEIEKHEQAFYERLIRSNKNEQV